MSVSHLVPLPVPRVDAVPPVAWPDGELRTCELTLLEIDHEADELFVARYRGDGENVGWRDAFLASKSLCQSVYSARYPEYELTLEEPHDANACLLFSRAGGHGAAGVLRVCFDSERGLPSEASLRPEIDTLRRSGIRIAEPGRFALPGAEGRYKSYLRALYQVARATGVQLFLMQVRARHADFYRRSCAAVDLDSTLAAPGCVNLAWNLERTPARFFRIFGSDQSHLSNFLAARECHR